VGVQINEPWGYNLARYIPYVFSFETRSEGDHPAIAKTDVCRRVESL
ncbi:MAG: hypothetical protein JO283_16605, partial [Bradyrhizobium sp.]|nr:hypothetical protein [Bradyrhizobium sp.]